MAFFLYENFIELLEIFLYSFSFVRLHGNVENAPTSRKPARSGRVREMLSVDEG
jgi:hypothetical protein